MFIVFLIIYYSSLKIRLIDSIPIGVEFLLLFVWIFYYFYYSLSDLDLESGIYERSSFWFVVGIFVYLASTFFLNILGNSIDDKRVKEYYYFSYLGDILRNILFAVAIYIYPKNQLAENTKKAKESTLPYLDMN